MYEQVEKPKENKSRAVANSVAQKKSNGKQGFGFVDNRPKTLAQRNLLQLKIRQVEWGEGEGKYYSDLDPEKQLYDSKADAEKDEGEWEDVEGSEQVVDTAEIVVMKLLERADVLIFDNDVSMITDDALEDIRDLGRPRLSLADHLKGNDLAGYKALVGYIKLTNAQNASEIELHDGKKITVVKKGAKCALQLYHKNPPMFSKEKEQLKLFEDEGIGDYFLRYFSWDEATFSNLVEALGNASPNAGSEDRIKDELREKGWNPWDLTNNNIGARLNGTDVIYDLSSVKK